MRAGAPFQCGSGSPFISQAISVFSSIAFQAGMLFTKSGVASSAPLSAPLNSTSTASFDTPAFASTSLSRTPFQRALPIAP